MMEPECKYESEETKDGIPIVSVERTESGYWRARKGDVEEVGENAVRALVNLSRLCRDEAEEDKVLLRRLGQYEIDCWRTNALEAGDDETVILLGQDCGCPCGCDNRATCRDNASGAWLCDDCSDFVVMPDGHAFYGEVVCSVLTQNWTSCPACKSSIEQRGTSGDSYCDCARWSCKPDGWHVQLADQDACACGAVGPLYSMIVGDGECICERCSEIHREKRREEAIAEARMNDELYPDDAPHDASKFMD